MDELWNPYNRLLYLPVSQQFPPETANPLDYYFFLPEPETFQLSMNNVLKTNPSFADSRVVLLIIVDVVADATEAIRSTTAFSDGGGNRNKNKQNQRQRQTEHRFTKVKTKIIYQTLFSFLLQFFQTFLTH